MTPLPVLLAALALLYHGLAVWYPFLTGFLSGVAVSVHEGAATGASAFTFVARLDRLEVRYPDATVVFTARSDDLSSVPGLSTVFRTIRWVAVLTLCSAFLSSITLVLCVLGTDISVAPWVQFQGRVYLAEVALLVCREMLLRRASHEVAGLLSESSGGGTPLGELRGHCNFLSENETSHAFELRCTRATQVSVPPLVAFLVLVSLIQWDEHVAASNPTLKPLSDHQPSP